MNIVFIFSSRFPYGEAYSSRARNLVKLLCECGHHVHVIALKGKEDYCSELDGYDYSCQYVHDPKDFWTLSGIGTHKPYMEALENYSLRNSVDLVLSSSMVFVADHIEKFCEEKKIPYIIEQCEWYDASIFKGGKFNPYYREHVKRIVWKNKSLDAVIAISSLLEKHYASQGMKTIRIPTILDVKNTQWRNSTTEEGPVRIIFAGSIGKGKERFDHILTALKEINSDEVRIVLDIFGADEQQVRDNLGDQSQILDELKECMVIHGRIPQRDIEDQFRNADYSIFMRPERNSSNAGFPTKLAESMAVGTPVITNNTGDIRMYLINGFNGFLLEKPSSEKIYEVFESICNRNASEDSAMRCNARKTAEKYFSFRRYIEPLNNLLLEVINNDKDNRQRTRPY